MSLNIKIYLIILCVFCSNLALASKLVILHEANQHKNGLLVRNIFLSKYNIPKDLITLKAGECDYKKDDKRFLYLCVNKKGELLLLSSNIDFKIKSLMIFKSH